MELEDILILTGRDPKEHKKRKRKTPLGEQEEDPAQIPDLLRLNSFVSNMSGLLESSEKPSKQFIIPSEIKNISKIDYSNIFSFIEEKKEEISFSKNKIEINSNLQDYLSDHELNLESVLQKNIIQINPNISKIQQIYSNIGISQTPFISPSPVGIGLKLGSGAPSITAENIAQYVLPIVQYIHETEPDYIIASDRGGRLIGLAVKMLYQRLYGQLPTVDRALRFRRFSTVNSTEETSNHLMPLVNEMLRNRKRPKVLVLDDWICGGGTKCLAENTLKSLSNGKIKVKYGVLLGKGADVSGQEGHSSGFAGTVDWHDASYIIGVNYAGTRAIALRSQESKNYRQRMLRAIDEFASGLMKESRKIRIAG